MYNLFLKIFITILTVIFLNSQVRSEVISNTDFSVQEISRSEVIGIFTGKIRFFNQVRVYPVILPLEHLTTKLFLINDLNINPSLFYNIRSELEETGRISEMIQVDSETSMALTVSIKHGAIGYLSSSFLVMVNNKKFILMKIVD